VRWFDIKVSIVHEKSRAHKEEFTHLIDTTLMEKLTQRNHHYSHIKNMFIPIEKPDVGSELLTRICKSHEHKRVHISHMI
jgi:hypothetical protein